MDKLDFLSPLIFSMLYQIDGNRRNIRLPVSYARDGLCFAGFMRARMTRNRKEGLKTYVKTESRDPFFPEGQPKDWQIVLAYLAGVAIVAFVVLGFHPPFREYLGYSLGAHGLIVSLLVLGFFVLISPRMRAKRGNRKKFERRLRSGAMRRAGLLAGHFTDLAILPDKQTLQITVGEEWMEQPYEKRLKDAQNLWRCWASAFLPYGGDGMVFIRLVDGEGCEVGGSKASLEGRPQEGSLIWVLEKDK